VVPDLRERGGGEFQELGRLRGVLTYHCGLVLYLDPLFVVMCCEEGRKWAREGEKGKKDRGRRQVGTRVLRERLERGLGEIEGGDGKRGREAYHRPRNCVLTCLP